MLKCISELGLLASRAKNTQDIAFAAMQLSAAVDFFVVFTSIFGSKLGTEQ